MEKNLILGIDLGTTNSLVSYWDGQESKLLSNSLQEYLTPSVVSLDDDGKILVGKLAVERLITHPHRTVANFKRYMGTDKLFQLGPQKYRAEELASFLIRALKEDAEFHLNKPVSEAIISVPAYFNNNQRAATKIAGELAGIKVERLINEPTAAAISYGLHDKNDNSLYFVFDLGGGTFDVSILEVFDGIMEVRASAGDNYLGGEDFLQIIIKYFLDTHNLKEKNLTPQDLNKLTFSAENCKKSLSKETTSLLTATINGKVFSTTIDRSTFESLCENLMQRLRSPIERVLKDASLNTEELNNVVLVGGATKMPLIRSIVSRIFGRLPFFHIDPEKVVALGAGIQSGLKMMDKALEDVVVTDVAPYSLGIGVTSEIDGNYIEGQFLPIIERNTVIPASRVQSVCTAQPMQNVIDIDVFQGESRHVKNNIKIGSFSIDLKPTREKQRFDVRFTYDINGLLEVEVLKILSGEKVNRVFSNNHSSLSEEEIKKRIHDLASIKLHPRDQTEIRMLLAKSEALYERLLGDLRENFKQHLIEFDVILEKQDPNKIKIASEELNQIIQEFSEI